MSGHSKWANIKRKKGINDAAKSNVFSKMSRLITSAVGEGGGIGDPDKNFKLRLAVDRAKAANMPKDTIQRAIDKAAGAGASAMKEALYEAFGPGNVGLIITAITDNPNRTVSELKVTLDRNGGKLASPNAVSYLFQKSGIVEILKSDAEEEKVFELFDQLGGRDLEDDGESYVLYIPFENVGHVREILGDIPVQTIDIVYVPTSPIEITDDVSTKVDQLIEKLDDLEDVQMVYHNMKDIS